MPYTAPSEGQKVTAGQHAPVTHEGPGPVPEGSLAAESQSFREANDVNPENLSSARPYEDTHTHARTRTTASEQGGAAPTYVESAYRRDPAGPHGKNITEDEGIATEDKARNASYAEVGSAADPGRAAEKKFTSGVSAATAGTGAGREKDIGGKTGYDVLGSERGA
ncbi:hypothetical protein F4809DRAFT_314946 [Biscogniauxia mediterranea]|nr:hypothetical protein F4809DRAFT_314946 [Biscogniauxia mediterranea]